MFPVIEYIKTCLNGIRLRIEKVEKSISKALASVKAQLADIIQDIKNVRIENAEAIKSSTADWGQNDSNALDYVKNRTHYMLPATPIGSLDFTATATDTIAYTITSEDSEFAIFSYFQNLRNKGEVLKVIVGGKEGLLAVTFDRGYFGFSGVFTGSVYWRAGNVLSLVVQNNFITFNQGNTYTASFEDTTTPYYVKLDFNYMPDNVYHSENAPVKFGAGENSTVQGGETTAAGSNAHAEGTRSAATGSSSHAEGIYTVASGYGSHAEGDNTKASGAGSHAEGYGSNASGDYANAGGDHTVANRRGMHAEGKYNLYDSAKYVDVVGLSDRYSWSDMYAASEYTFDADTGYYTLVNAEPKNEAVIGLYYVSSKTYASGTITRLEKPISLISGNNYKTEKHLGTLGTDAQGKYVHVVGNGVSSARSNAYTLDWDGNGWFAGDVFVGGTGQDEGVKLLKAGEAIPIPQTASVGQVLAVKAVGENAKPTEWEPVDIPTALPNPNALTFTGAVTGSYDGSAPLSVEIPSGGSGVDDISLGVTGATVGQIAKITAVDDTGKPTAWEPVDMPTGGGERTFEKVVEMTTAEDAAVISISTDKNGNPLSMSEFYVAITTARNSEAIKNNNFNCNVLPDTVPSYIRARSAIKSLTLFQDVYCYVMHYKVVGGMIFHEYTGKARTSSGLNVANYLENEKNIGIIVGSGETTGFLSPSDAMNGESKIDSSGKMYCITFGADSTECIFGAGTRVEVWAR